MKRKSFFKSKINWSAIIMILTAIIPLIEQQNFDAMTWQSWIVFVLSVLIIVFRTYFTNTAIKAPRKR